MRDTRSSVGCVTTTDVRTLITRLDRSSRAMAVGCATIAGQEHPNPGLVLALADTAREVVALGHELTVEVAYGDFWEDLPALLDRWSDIACDTAAVRACAVPRSEAVLAAEDMRRTVQRIADAAEQVDLLQLEVAAHRRDGAALQRLEASLTEMEAAADQCFVHGLHEPFRGRLDASMAILTCVAARTTRERMALRGR